MSRLKPPANNDRKPVPRKLVIGLLLIPLALFFRFVLIGYSTTAYLLLAVAALLLLLHFLRKRKVVTRLLLILTLIAVVVLSAAEIPVIVASRGDKDADADYLVVLGAGVNGTVPSLSLVNRLTAVESYLNSHPDAVAIVSGGQGPCEDITEAQAMYDWLTAQGIDGSRIILEDKATSTKENLQFSFDIIRERGDDPADGVAIVSSEYHLYRAKNMAARMGATPYGVAGRTTIFTLRINYFLREAFAVWYLWVFGM